MGNTSSNNIRIAQNTILLYFRMFLMMFIGLYTSRVILQSLGVDDFGIYNVVGGFVVMFGALSGSLSNAISRFVQVELGKNNIDRLKQVFSTSITVQVIIGAVIIIIAEAIGIWFLNSEMQIPNGRLNAATWILHFSIISFFVGLISVPYNSAIIAHEKMSAFAYISLIEATLKLLVAFSIFWTPIDKLITYGVLILLSQILVQIVYVIYCRSNFVECRFNLNLDKGLLREMSAFAGWNLFSHGTTVLNVQGTNMLLNVFFGVTVNAARGISNQVNNAVQQFITNFMTAITPQITKSYAAGDTAYSFSLVCRGARFSYYIMLFLSMPIIIEAEQILTLWLKNPPEYAVPFTQWTLAASLTTVFGSTLFNLVMADGRIRKYQIAMAIVSFFPFPLTWIAFSLGMPVISAFIIYFVVYFALIFVRFYLASEVTGLPARDYLIGVILRVLIVTCVSSLLPTIVHLSMDSSFARLLCVTVLTVMCIMVTIYTIGLTSNEKGFIHTKISQVIKRL